MFILSIFYYLFLIKLSSDFIHKTFKLRCIPLYVSYLKTQLLFIRDVVLKKPSDNSPIIKNFQNIVVSYQNILHQRQ